MSSVFQFLVLFVESATFG